MASSEKVTIVRRRVVYEELVMDKAEFESINEKLENDEEFCLNDLKMSDIGFPCFTEEEIEYVAFPEDVTSYTDDAIVHAHDFNLWNSGYAPLKCSYK
jgi:hypothetical protein